MLCISRYTDDTYAQHFGDGRHKFYLEFRCNRPCTNGNHCSKCSNKSPLTKLQQSRKFNHGNVNEPIPDISHIFGGKWYNNGIKKWGEPPSEIIEFAIKYRGEARQGFESATIPLPLNPVKLQKPNVTLEPISEPTLEPILELAAAVIVPKKRGKPKVAGESTDGSEPKKRIGRKKPIVTPYTTLINATSQIVHKEVSLPTHIESKMEEIDSSGYTIQYIKLAPFDANGVSYFRDATKNKLYKKVKDKIGGYIGRWNPDTDSIIIDIPDSDDEE
jgi:hypothetical protein